MATVFVRGIVEVHQIQMEEVYFRMPLQQLSKVQFSFLLLDQILTNKLKLISNKKIILYLYHKMIIWARSSGAKGHSLDSTWLHTIYCFAKFAKMWYFRSSERRTDFTNSIISVMFRFKVLPPKYYKITILTFHFTILPFKNHRSLESKHFHLSRSV